MHVVVQALQIVIHVVGQALQIVIHVVGQALQIVRHVVQALQLTTHMEIQCFSDHFS